jgi:CheY-like chemotaxis protein
MIVEDDRHISRVVALWLTRHGHEVRSAEDGVKALEMIRSEAPDMLITDVNLPRMDGLELLEIVRREGLIKSKAVVLTSRCDQQEIESRLINLEAVVHPKPFSPLHLMETVERALADNPRCGAGSIAAAEGGG